MLSAGKTGVEVIENEGRGKETSELGSDRPEASGDPVRTSGKQEAVEKSVRR